VRGGYTISDIKKMARQCCIMGFVSFHEFPEEELSPLPEGEKFDTLTDISII